MKILGAITAMTLACIPLPALGQGTAAVQSALTILGYDPGPVDGLWGSKTRLALEEYYSGIGREFTEPLSDRHLITILAALESRITTRFPPANAESLNLDDNFQRAIDVWFPAQYAFSDGADEPARPEFDFAVLHPFVHDFNGDGCDDILVQFMDSNAHPNVIYGRPGNVDGPEFIAEPALDIPRTRSIRNVAISDLDGDGNADFVGFTAPHGLDGLGYVPRPEHEIIIPQNGQAWQTAHATYAHGGLVGDVNGDGISDIFPIAESASTARHALLGNGKGEFVERFRVTALARDFIFDAHAADLNGDGIDDFVFTVSLDYTREKQVPPARVGQHGALAIALGQEGKSINQLEFTRIGSHPMDELHWAAFGLQHAMENDADLGYVGGQPWTYSAPSNVDLLDFDGDGDLDILVGYFVSANSGWLTSGFRIYENDNGQFSDVTTEIAPHQPANLKPGLNRTDAMIGSSMIDLDGDGTDDLLLSIQTPDMMHHSRFRASMYLNVDGRFLPVQSGNDATRNASMLTVGDFNCDGVTDIVGNGPHSRNQYSIRIILGRP